MRHGQIGHAFRGIHPNHWQIAFRPGIGKRSLRPKTKPVAASHSPGGEYPNNWHDSPQRGTLQSGELPQRLEIENTASRWSGEDPQDPVNDRTHSLAAITAIIWSTTEAADTFDVSINRASSAGTNGATERERSRVSRLVKSALVSSSAPECPAATSSRCRRWALTVGSASRKNFTSAEGNTFVPISRPSATTAPLCPICR